MIEGKGFEDSSFALVKLVLELHPVQSKWMEEAFQTIHADEHSESGGEEEGEDQEQLS